MVENGRYMVANLRYMVVNLRQKNRKKICDFFKIVGKNDLNFPDS